jgi:hypothetical protein
MEKTVSKLTTVTGTSSCWPAAVLVNEGSEKPTCPNTDTRESSQIAAAKTCVRLIIMGTIGWIIPR